MHQKWISIFFVHLLIANLCLSLIGYEWNIVLHSGEPQVASLIANYEMILHKSTHFDKDTITASESKIDIHEEFSKERYQVGLEYFRKKDYTNAIETFLTVLKWSSNFPEAHIFLAESYSHTEQYDKSIEQYLILLTNIQYPMDPSAETALIYNDLGCVYWKAKQLYKAEEFLMKSISANENNENVLKNLGDVLILLKRFDLALKTYTKISMKFPASEEAYTRLGLIYFKLDMHDECITQCSNALILNDDSLDAHIGKANCLQDRLLKHRIESLDPLGFIISPNEEIEIEYHIDRALEINPKDSSALTLKMLFLIQNFRYTESQEFIKENIFPIYPDSIDAHIIMGYICYYSRKTWHDEKEAVEWWKKAVLLNENSEKKVEDFVMKRVKEKLEIYIDRDSSVTVPAPLGPDSEIVNEENVALVTSYECNYSIYQIYMCCSTTVIISLAICAFIQSANFKKLQNYADFLLTHNKSILSDKIVHNHVYLDKEKFAKLHIIYNNILSQKTSQIEIPIFKISGELKRNLTFHIKKQKDNTFKMESFDEQYLFSSFFEFW